jgi:cytochrome c553
LRTHKSLTKAAAAVLILVTVISPGYAQKRWAAPLIVTTYCSGCHGIDGNSQLPYIPRLAGLDATYAEKKITAFKEPVSPPVDELIWSTLKVIRAKKDADNVTRDERINMEGVAHAAKPELIREAVLWYSRQTPAPGRCANKMLVDEGKNLFRNGLPAQKVLACTSCHGAEGLGKGLAPRLAGQNAEYIESQLDKFRNGDRRHAPEMTMVTRDLGPEAAHAVAVYLQSK